MNNNHAHGELKYKKRWLKGRISSALKSFPVVVVTGARQVGKSTFLLNEFPSYNYLTMDNYDTLKQAQLDPLSLISDKKLLIIDEVQREPKLLIAIKVTVDKDRSRRIIVSGSSNLLLMKHVSESLAGRAAYLEMMPMSDGELSGSDKLPTNFFSLWDKPSVQESRITVSADLPSTLIRGFMPVPAQMENSNDYLVWWESYVRTYLERDLRELSQIESLVDFRNVMSSIALRTGFVMNQSEIARGIKISQPTVNRYIKLLEISNVLVKVPAYSRSRGKRLVKSPKLYYIDSALGTFLSGIHTPELLNKSREADQHFEALVLMHLKILTEMMVPKGSIFFWRTISGKEVDFIIEQGRKIIAIEVKISQKISISDINHILEFIDEYPQTVIGIVVYSGSEIKRLHSKVVAMPWTWLFQ